MITITDNGDGESPAGWLPIAQAPRDGTEFIIGIYARIGAEGLLEVLDESGAWHDARVNRRRPLGRPSRFYPLNGGKL